MASVVCMCAIVLLAAVGQATNIVKGLYCRDPDTGKLYPVNATWPSESFCGNYTCKLRKRNITETEYAPIQSIDLTQFRIPNEVNIGNDMDISSSDNSVVIAKKTNNDIQPIFHKDLFKSKVKDTIINNKDLKDNDGYLTESEIKTITDMLYTVKKSDLEAIVDIYNLAQNIYKEIDSVSKEQLVKNKQPIDERKFKKTDKNQQSYWYDPAQYHNKLIDMSREETKVISTTKPPLDSNPTFFKGPLSNGDFGKLPYYYPMSNFQRLSSYTHTKPSYNDLEKATTETKPCIKAANNYNYVSVPGYNAPVKKPGATVQPSTLLPYPFSYIYHYNVSDYPPNYYYSYPWAYAEYNRHRNYHQPYYGGYIVQIPSMSAHYKGNIPEKEMSSKLNNSGELQDRLNKATAEKNPLPDWQTRPLSEQVIEEVRAHLEKPKALKPIQLKNNIKLERVGKVINLDELTRTKRELQSKDIEYNVNENYSDDFEAYIDRTTCEDSTEPGYFSIGNMSQPYPACCPRKLDSIHTAREVIKIN